MKSSSSSSASSSMPVVVIGLGLAAIAAGLWMAFCRRQDPGAGADPLEDTAEVDATACDIAVANDAANDVAQDAADDASDEAGADAGAVRHEPASRPDVVGDET